MEAQEKHGNRKNGCTGKTGQLERPDSQKKEPDSAPGTGARKAENV